MTTNEGSKWGIERILLIVISVLFLIAVVVLIVTNVGKTGQTIAPDLAKEPAALPEEDAQTAPGAEESSEEPDTGAAPSDVTPTPRRLTLAPTPTAFQVASEDDPRAILDGSPDGFDYFDESTWFEYDTEGTAAYSIGDGQLNGIDYDPADNFIYWSFNNAQSGNVYSEITTTNGDCIEKDAVGFVIRVQGDKSPSGYALEVACDGTWRLRRYRGAKATEELVDWTSSEAINAGPFESNRLGIWGYQGKFYLFINDVMVGEHFDADYPYTYGFFAVYVRGYRTYDLTATFDNFALWHLPFME
jgi:hypothetical protein